MLGFEQANCRNAGPGHATSPRPAMPRLSLDLFRLYLTRPVTARCGCCGRLGRLGVVDLDGRFPLCQDCLPASIQAAESLRLAGLIPPGPSLIERNP